MATVDFRAHDKPYAYKEFVRMLVAVTRQTDTHLAFINCDDVNCLLCFWINTELKDLEQGTVGSHHFSENDYMGEEQSQDQTNRMVNVKM
ncbi:hypothetical protein Hamer_G015821 [Homarus americanus]|uniref:Uncharacterized protein n=1 Tax=Homarus americanus TaxID=6706 RepID=A0A8J5JEU2_HOMAM|nr:hypothetical protein Hamer_G015821 [Homarus americanus]